MDWKNKLELSPQVFFPAVIVIAVFLVFGAGFTDTAGTVFDAVQDGIVANFGWFYILSVAFFLGFVVFLLFSRYGSIRLGPDDSEPEYSYFSWFAMLFSAGMGIGLVFFSVAEPIFHYVDPPLMEGGTQAAAEDSMRLTFFHWGFHAWAIYIVVGLSLAYFSFRKGLPLSIRSAFHPLLGDRIYGPMGHLIDILAIFGTLFGVATSLGLGVMQVNAGLDFLLDVGISDGIQIGLITVITLVATVSVVAGVDKGIRRLSNFNMVMALSLVLFVFVTGPTVFILNSWMENTGNYVQQLVTSTFWIDAWGDGDWHGGWTLFYWGWWIAWSPFVGMFIARISRGRTIREFVGGVLMVPAAFTTFWLTTFGNTALQAERADAGVISDLATEQMLFALLQGMPLTVITSIIAVVVIIAFFVTSSDSGSLVIDMLASGGNQDPPKIQRVFWALLEGAVAAMLLFAGGLGALQTAAIATGLPFAVVLTVMCFALLKALRAEGEERTRRRKVFPAKGRESTTVQADATSAGEQP
ncbi:MAG: BCCT family transporter [Gemmatimonadales bacterium]|nr:MAG: BCCT family transporter [Gemmatimonadales bacterium]